MSFKDLTLKKEYRSLHINVVEEFYIPVLEQAILYKRAVGFFSSTALIHISKGITGLIRNNGKIQLIVSPNLSEADIDAIDKGYELREEVISKVITCAIALPKNIFEEERLNLLASLIAEGRLDIRVALAEVNKKIGLFHDKMGILYDRMTNVIAFSGSMNETGTAFSHNYESIDVFTSWSNDLERVKAKESAFSKIWSNQDRSIRSYDFPELAKDKLCSYKKSYINLEIDKEELEAMSLGDSTMEVNDKYMGPIVPESIKLFDYQQEAIDEWRKRDFVGIFDMATGTGKTYTGLAAIADLFDYLGGSLAVFIVCPFQHLVNQWVEDIIKFNMRPIVGHSASQQRNWKERLENSSEAFRLKELNHFCFISTNATFSSEFVQRIIGKLDGNIVLLIDEAHNFGSENLSKTLIETIPYRLALSATIERHGDEEGTSKLFNYFKGKCIEYSLERAIRNNKLSPYYYYPIVVTLNDEELSEYKSITAKISKHINFDSKGKQHLSELGKMLLIKRARIVAAASEKVDKLEKAMEQYIEGSHILVYCGAASLRDPNYKESVVDDEDKRQIDIIADLLGNKLRMRISKFTSEESAAEREILKEAFAEGVHIQALVAIRCLDEGVNIPSIKTAFILASSTNPKEYIQRRGRVLRKYPNKKYAVIYDFVTLPVPLQIANESTKGELAYGNSLVLKEINRMKEFASISENPAEVDKLINDISHAFKLNIIRGNDDA